MPTPSPSTPAVAPGQKDFTTSGTSSFVIPPYNSLTVQVWGAGGSGGGCNDHGSLSSSWPGFDGQPSMFGSVIAGGGQGGVTGAGIIGPATSGGGVGGVPSGGSTNISGNKGGSWGGANFFTSPGIGAGGSSPNGGGGGTPVSITNITPPIAGGDGGWPGGGGAGNAVYSPILGLFLVGDGGGGGAYAARTYSAGAFTVGGSVQVVVGAGARNSSGNAQYCLGGRGAAGRVLVTWQ